jgi:hypothetical protein
VKEPSSIFEAKTRLGEAKRATVELQGKLAVLPKPPPYAAPAVVAAYKRKRADIITRMTVHQQESSELKGWLTATYQQRRLTERETTGGDDIEGAMKSARDATVGLCRIIGQLRGEIEELQKENAALRERLRGEPEPVAAPTDAGHDYWRDETTP